MASPSPMRAVQARSNVAVTMYYLFKALPVMGGIFSIYLGYRLFILGVTGQASLSINSGSVSGQLLNAAPGLFFAVGGIVTLIVAVRKGVQVTLTPNREDYKQSAARASRGRASI